MKESFIALMGAIGATVGAFFGGWDLGLSTLVIAMALDYITGLIVAGVFKKSDKSKSGALESNAGFKGLCKKAVMLFIVLLGHRLDLTMGTTIVKDAVVFGFIANEAISIIENAGLMGIPVGDTIKNAIDVLGKRGDKNGRN